MRHLLFLSLLFSVSGFAGEICPETNEYQCEPAPRNKDVGEIVMCGDVPGDRPFKSVYMNGVSQKIKIGATSNVYLYLSDFNSGKSTGGLEVVNYPFSLDSYSLSVYAPNTPLMMSRTLSTYICKRR